VISRNVAPASCRLSWRSKSARWSWLTGGDAGATFACLLVIFALASQANAMSAKDILKKAGQHYEVIQDYTADAKVTVESPSMHVPEMSIKIYYKKPDKLHVESKDGFAVLPKQGAVVGNPLKYLMTASELTLDRSERMLGDDCYVIKGTFQREGREVQSTVWVEKKNFLVRQIATNPEWGPSVKAKLWYTRVGLKYWLPSMTSARVSIPPLPGETPDSKGGDNEPTTVNIKFEKYRVNTGLSDKIFKNK